MKTAIAMLCAVVWFSVAALAQEKTTTSTSTQDLVKAAKETKAKRRQSSTKVITNKDVRKSKGKLIVLNTPAEKTTPPAKTDTIGPLEKQDELFRQRKDAQARVAAAQKKVDGLQKELDSIEQRYYEENDPNYRDSVIQKRFAQTKRQLDDAQHELADARDALKKLEPKS